MATTIDPRLSREDAQSLADAFSAAIESRPTDVTTKALAAGMNFRLNVGQALKAGYYGAKLWFKAHAAPATGGVSIGDGIELANDAVSLVKSALDAIRERVPPDAYVALIVLGSEPTGIKKEAFRETLTAFVNDASKIDEQPWYVGLSSSRIKAAKTTLEKPGGFDDLVAYLKKEGWVTIEGDTIKVKPRNFELGLSFS
jgi:hypothetical protein